MTQEAIPKPTTQSFDHEVIERLEYLAEKAGGHLVDGDINLSAKHTPDDEFADDLWTLGTLPSFMMLQICEQHQARAERLVEALNSTEANKLHSEAIYITEAMRLFIAYELKTNQAVLNLEDMVKEAIKKTLGERDWGKQHLCHGIAGKDSECEWSGEQDPVPPLFSGDGGAS